MVREAREERVAAVEHERRVAGHPRHGDPERDEEDERPATDDELEAVLTRTAVHHCVGDALGRAAVDLADDVAGSTRQRSAAQLVAGCARARSIPAVTSSKRSAR